MRVLFRRLLNTALVATSPMTTCPAIGSELSAQSTSWAEVDLRLGGVEAPDHLAFVRPPSILAGPNGKLFVLDHSASTVWVLSPQGDLDHHFGGRGQGPGEFTIPQSFGFLSDTVWVTDFPTSRVSYFAHSGEHLRTERVEVFDLGVPTSAPNTFTALHDGGFATLVPRSFPVGQSGRVELPVLHGRREGPLSEVGRVVMPPGLTIPRVGHFAFHPVTISPRVTEDRQGGGWVVAEWAEEAPEDLTVRRLDPDGSLRWSTHLSIPSVVVDREAIVAAGLEMALPLIEAAIRRGEVSGDAREMVERGLYLPSRATSLGEMFIDADDRTWLETARPGQVREWLVLSPDGSLEHRVRISDDDVHVHTASGSVAWGLSFGAFNETYLVRLRF